MLAGRRPFAGNSDLGLITSILRDQPPPLRSVRPGVPAEVQAIVDRCLAKDPDARYADARALKTELDRAHAKLTRPAEPGLAAAGRSDSGGARAHRQRGFRRRGRRFRPGVSAGSSRSPIPEIERLQMTDVTLDAVRLARQAERYAPDEIARVRAVLVSAERRHRARRRERRDQELPRRQRHVGAARRHAAHRRRSCRSDSSASGSPKPATRRPRSRWPRRIAASSR